MKKLLCIISLFIHLGFANAQQAILFKVKYLPNHTYRSTTDLSTMDVTKSSPLPGMRSNLTNNYRYRVTTGEVTPEGDFSAIFRYLKYAFDNSGGDLIIQESKNESDLIDQTIYGKCDTEGKFRVVSFSPQASSERINEAMVPLANRMQELVMFPDRPLRVGESFTQELIMDTPMNSQCSIKEIYRLTAINDSLAYFDIDKFINSDTVSEKGGMKRRIKIRAKGAGKIIYNIKACFPELITSDLDMTCTGSTATLSLTLDYKISSRTQNEINSN